MRRGSGLKNVSSFKAENFVQERKILHHIYQKHRKSKRLPVSFFIYSKAMSRQLFKEAEYYTYYHSASKGKFMGLRAALYYPFDKELLIFLIRHILGLKTLKSLVRIKKIFVGKSK